MAAGTRRPCSQQTLPPAPARHQKAEGCSSWSICSLQTLPLVTTKHISKNTSCHLNGPISPFSRFVPPWGQLLGRNCRIGAWLCTPLYELMPKPRSLPWGSTEMWQKLPGSHSKAPSNLWSHPGCEGISLGQWLGAVPRCSAPPFMADKGALGAALWLTAQEQTRSQENWKVLIERQ